MESISELLIRACRENGAFAAARIGRDGVVYDPSFRDICKSNTCGMYGRCYACPPDVGPVEELIRKAKAYPYGVLYQTVGQLEDSFDYEGMQEAKKQHLLTVRTVDAAARKILRREFLHLGTGGCNLCEKCAKLTGEPCRFPDRVIPSISGYGVNVSATSKNAGLKYVNGQDTVTYFALMLFGEE